MKKDNRSKPEFNPKDLILFSSLWTIEEFDKIF